MSRSTSQLVRDMFTGPNTRATIILLTSAICLAAWHVTGSYKAWADHMPAQLIVAGDPALSAALWAFVSGVLLLGVVPLLVVKFALRESLADYGVQWGDVRFALICCMWAAPLVVAIGYSSAQMPEFQAMYPLNPLARQSYTALAWHIVGQLFWLAAWEFHFRGFLAARIGKIVQRTVGNHGANARQYAGPFRQTRRRSIRLDPRRPTLGRLAWRTRSLLASTFQHWLLGEAWISSSAESNKTRR